MHGCVTTHIGTQPIRETFLGETVWDGDVEVFEIIKGHPKATHCYAWSHNGDKEGHVVVILALPPALTPLDAVKAFIVSRAKKTC